MPNASQSETRVALRYFGLVSVLGSSLVFLRWLLIGRSSNRWAWRRKLEDNGSVGGKVVEPEELICSICCQLFRDPVVTTKGFTYERTALLEYWRSPACQDGPRDPRAGNLPSEKRLAPNWQMRHLVERFLDEHPGYIPEGWPDRTLLPPTREDGGDAVVLPGGLVSGDVVVSLQTVSFAARQEQLRAGEVGKVLGQAASDPHGKVHCSFPDFGDVDMPWTAITKRNLPGGYRVGDVVVSLIDHAGADETQVLQRGDVGKVVSQATVDAEARVKVDFPNMKGVDIFPAQISPEELPGGYRVGDNVVSLINHDAGDGRTLRKGDVGQVAGQAKVDAGTRLRVNFRTMHDLDIFPQQISPEVLPGDHRVGARVVSLVDHQSEGGYKLSKGEVGTVVGKATVQPDMRLKVDFPTMPGLDICASQVKAQIPA